MSKNLNRWLGSYISQSLRRIVKGKKSAKPIHVMFCIVDHFEPDWNDADEMTQINRVTRWKDEYPKLVSTHKDADGCHPKYTFFYPAECYTKNHLDLLSEMCKEGLAEVEVHLHHDQDTEQGLKQKLEKAKKDFASHGFLNRREISERIQFAFIHGNWCLNNSRKDGRWCGVNNESNILNDVGCYADFTFPSAPSETQPRKINSLYYTKSSSEKAKTHNKGTNVKVGSFSKEDLMVIQGPLALNWRNRKNGIFPRIENGEISGMNLPKKERVDIWINQHISVEGKPDWIFVKVHTHGAPEKNADTLLGEPMDKMYTYLENKYNDGTNFALHYVTAREMYNIIKAAEAGEPGNPGDYRNYMLVSNLTKITD